MTDLCKDAAAMLEINETAAGQRIDNYLSRLARGVPRSHLHRIIRSGEVRVNKGRVRADYKLQDGDRVRVPPMDIAATAQKPPAPAREFAVVFEDDALLVIDKPAGVAVHGGSGVSFGVIEQLRRARPLNRFLELAHRLDRETSGLLLIAKKRAALTRLHELFREGGMNKRYLALACGAWRNPVQHVRLPLAKYLDAAGERRVSVAAPDAGKAAHSIVRRVSRHGEFSLLEVELKTGRTHQIRVHLAHLGFPLAGDDKYGDFARNKALQKQGLKRMFLHAAQLSLPHPLTHEPLELVAALPRELSTFLKKLDKETPCPA